MLVLWNVFFRDVCINIIWELLILSIYHAIYALITNFCKLKMTLNLWLWFNAGDITIAVDRKWFHRCRATGGPSAWAQLAEIARGWRKRECRRHDEQQRPVSAEIVEVLESHPQRSTRFFVRFNPWTARAPFARSLQQQDQQTPSGQITLRGRSTLNLSIFVFGTKEEKTRAMVVGFEREREKRKTFRSMKILLKRNSLRI